MLRSNTSDVSDSAKAGGAKPVVRNPWAWIPTLYLAEGIPYALVNVVSVIMYKSLGVSNAKIALYTSWLNLPWVLKPLWSPVVDILKTRRMWIWAMQLIVGAGLAGVALTIPGPHFFQYTLAFFWLLAFSSATHDIAADGFYMLATTEREQAFFSGIRNTSYRVATICGQGLLVILAGLIQNSTGLPSTPLQVEVKPGVSLVEMINTHSFTAAVPSEGKLRVISESTAIQISPQPRPKAEISKLIVIAKTWNIENGFCLAEEKPEAKSKKNSWWTRNISQPLGEFLKRHFGSDTNARSDIAGNIGLTQVHLSKPPGREVVVTLGLASGDKSISIAEGSRFIFNDANWNKPALAVLQLDPKLKGTSSAVYEVRSGNIPLSWLLSFFVMVALFLLVGSYHKFILPMPTSDQPGNAASIGPFLDKFFATFGSFFRKPQIPVLLLFLLFYRFGEAQLMKMVSPFLLDTREVGGLGLTTGQVGLVYGTIGIIALMLGGIVGGFIVSQRGLRAWIWPMVFVMHLPDAVFIYLSYAQPDNLVVISACVAVEQFGYGFGFTAYMLYMIYIARGEHQTAHYAICTGFMALGIMLPGMWSGWLQELIGYQHFFTWVLLATIPSFLVVWLIPLDAEFGKKT
ncbi:MAG TPA: MFS transporter [Verrucomicrobiae bacterium]